MAPSANATSRSTRAEAHPEAQACMCNPKDEVLIIDVSPPLSPEV